MAQNKGLNQIQPTTGSQSTHSLNQPTSTTLVTTVDPGLEAFVPTSTLASRTLRLSASSTTHAPINTNQPNLDIVAFHAEVKKTLTLLHHVYPLTLKYEPLPPPTDPDIKRNVEHIRGIVVAAEQKQIFSRFGLPFVPYEKRNPGFFAEISRVLVNRIVAHWNPHPLTQQELQTLRKDSLRRLHSIHHLQRLQSRAAQVSVRDPRIDDDLTLSRLQLSARFFLTFRFNDLPTEIITNIFRYVVWSAPDIMKGVRARLWITWTCRSWRKLAIEDSTLWNAIWFREHPNFARSFEWLDRARSAPLDIRINDKAGHEFTAASMEQLLDRIFIKLSTIRMLIVIVDNWGPALAVLHKLRIAARSGAPMIMERFELHRHGSPFIQPGHGYQPPEYLDPIPLFGGVEVPTMRYFSTNAVHINWTQSFLANLTTLDIRRIPLERSPDLPRFRSILLGCPHLQKLILDGAGPTISQDLDGLQPIELPHLKVLVLANFSRLYGLYILPQISAPNVVDLTLMDLTGEDYSRFFASMTSKFPKVKLLTLWNVDSRWPQRSQRTMIRWLESMPSISYLRVANIPQNLLDLFLHTVPQTPSESGMEVDSPPDRALCEKLNILECHAISDPQSIARWGARKMEIGASLKKIYVGRKLVETLDRGQIEALRSVAAVELMPSGSKTNEEEAIHIGEDI